VSRAIASTADEAGWQVRVHNLMRSGLGVEEIAVELGCPACDVREEAELLRAQGRLDAMYGVAPAAAPPAKDIDAQWRADREAGREGDWMDAAMEDLGWAGVAKAQMKAKGLTRATKACLRCGAKVRLELLGPRRHLRAACPTPRCMRIME